jgi:copper chaperone
MTRETLSVPDMTCGHCRSSIEGALGGINGVQSVAVDLDNKRVQIDYDASKTNVATLISAVEGQGFDVATD